MFPSINRGYTALLPDGATYTPSGKGLSQGIPDAVRRVPAWPAACSTPSPQTRPCLGAQRLRPALTTREKHRRECFVVLEAGAEAKAVRKTIVTMPHYFDECA